ncbi:MAG TPA: hypothetical protein VHP13_02285 [Gammaproteobacteria bacterium]|jgi:hypothetical protein|nr:hypothetical protein [Gammaproteobacteria bacterium]
MRKLFALAPLLLLAGCASQRGEVLGKSALGYADAAFISVQEDEYFWIAPPAAGRHGVAPASMQIPRQGLWVREGWFIVEFQCFTPRDVPGVQDPILPETDDEKPVYIHAGHRYLLSCSPTRMGDIELTELPGSAAEM